MAPRDIVRKALDHGVFLYVQDDRLAYRAAPGALVDELKRELQEHRTAIIDYLKQVEASSTGGAPFVLPPIGRRPPGPVPASNAQRRLWFIDKLERGSLRYRIERAYRLRGPLNQRALVDALTTIVQRHESLRTVIAERNGTTYQTVLEEFSLEPRVTDLSDLEPAEQNVEAEVIRLIARGRRQPFDLARDLMIRVNLIILSPVDHVLFLELHHIATDAWSQQILRRELTALYTAYLNDLPNPLPPLTLQYADYTQWQQNWLRGEELTRLLEFWRAQLQGIPETHALPMDRERPVTPTCAGGICECVIGIDSVRKLRRVCARREATLFMCVHTALAMLLARWSGRTDIVVGTPVAGRWNTDLEPLIGFFVNTIVLRLKLDADATFEEMLGRERQGLLAALAHQYAPFEMVVEDLKPRRSLGFNPLFQILFAMPPVIDDAPFVLPGMTVEAINVAGRISQFDLIVNAYERGDQLSIVFDYSAETFEAATMSRMADEIRDLLSRVAANPDLRVSTLLR